jgi:GntR family transcriptional regulator, rspAB operon transcriptional repressor
MKDASETSVLVRETIYQDLRREVLNCTLRPGQQLQERELVERFGVSKSPIRDALLKLEEQGLVEVMPRKGYRVRRIDMRDVRDMYDIRLMLERECAVRLIETGSMTSTPGSTPSAPRPEDMPTSCAGLEYNRAFHSYIARNCGNARLARVSPRHHRTVRPSDLSERHVPPGESLADFVREHARIIDAIQARNRRRGAGGGSAISRARASGCSTASNRSIRDRHEPGDR